MKVENMKSAKTGKAVANQFIITDNEHNAVWFQSYTSVIALVNNGLLYLDKDKWDYSRTTAKYRNAFVAAYFSGKYASRDGIKAGVEDGKIIMTGLNNR